MHRHLRMAVVVAASMSLVASAVGASEAPQTPTAAGSPDVQTTAGASAAAPGSPAPQSALPSPSTIAPAAGADGLPAAPAVPTASAGATNGHAPLIAYLKHTKAPVLIDSTPGTAAFAMIGAFAAISAGKSIVADNAIQDPSGDMAHELATAYAASRSGRVAETPLSDDHLLTLAKSESLADQANGAGYVVDVEPPGMNLLYFSLDWSHFDLLFLSRVRIIDTSNGQVIARARCFLKSQKTPGAMTHAELLADGAAALKQLIASKSQACVVKMKADLKL